MQFIRNGPDVPERLLQAHEDGRVVFFCGAGISYPAGLPGFKGLVDKLYATAGVQPCKLEKLAITNNQYDTAIKLLEERIVGGRAGVRKELTSILTPDLMLPRAKETHKALLTLGRTRGSESRYRIVTSNFDRLFEEVRDRTVATFQAPYLPAPKNRWSGLVYLHGLLAAEPSDDELNRLVLSSGDFSLAYLLDGWAARFVGELFRSYTVCFVGYSISDPVLRYMMDALAADRLLGEKPLEHFAFGSYSKGREEHTSDDWKAKNVTPILYREYRRHFYLHQTLREWAEIYRDGVQGKEQIVLKHAISTPIGSTKQDDYVGRVLWALGDPSGKPAKLFAELDQPREFEWLEKLIKSNWSDEVFRLTLPAGSPSISIIRNF